jgi:hypothetical protein
MAGAPWKRPGGIITGPSVSLVERICIARLNYGQLRGKNQMRVTVTYQHTGTVTSIEAWSDSGPPLMPIGLFIVPSTDTG